MSEQKRNDEIVMQIAGKSFKPYFCLLTVVLSTLVQILSSSTLENASIIVSLYFNIVLVLVSICYIGVYGVLAATLSSLIYSVTIGQGLVNTCIIVFANLVQAILLYVFCACFKKAKEKQKEKTVIQASEIVMLILGGLYLTINLTPNSSFIVSSIVILALLAVVHICRAIKNKDGIYMRNIGLLLISSLVGASIGSVQYVNNSFHFDAYIRNFATWSLSNSILLLSFGYLLISFLRMAKKERGSVLTVKLSTVLFYISTIVWNAIIYVIYAMGWLDKSMSSYVFPWTVGTLFFLANLYYSTYDEIDDSEEERFKWFEKRAVVAENNTQMLVAIISLLLPICAQLLGSITYSISMLFTLNITVAIISIGLVWIPEGLVKHMATVKHVKTVFHLFTLSLLLLNIVMIINESVGI